MRTLCTLMFLALLCCLNGAPPLYAQDLRFEHIGTEHGLSNNSVESILQDRQGFIWIGVRDYSVAASAFGFTMTCTGT